MAQVLENLQSAGIPSPGLFRHHWHKGKALGLAGLLKVKVSLFVPSVRRSSGTFLVARLGQGLLPLPRGCRDGKIKGSRRSRKGWKVHIRRAPSCVVGIFRMLREQKARAFKFRAKPSSLSPIEN